MSPVVTAVMPAHNTARFIGAAIESVLAQTFADWELVVVDDASTDDTLAVVARYRDPRIRVVRFDRNRGRAAARNAAIACSAGRYVAPCDSDDISLPERFRREVELLDARPDVDVVSCQMAYFWGDGAPAVRFLYPESPDAIRRRFARGRMGIAHGPSMIRRACFDAHGGYAESLRRAEDFEWFARVHTQRRFESLPDVLYHYRHETQGISPRKWYETEWYHAYALRHAAALAASPGAHVPAFERFSTSWQAWAHVYGLGTLRFAKFVTQSYIAPARRLR